MSCTLRLSSAQAQQRSVENSFNRCWLHIVIVCQSENGSPSVDYHGCTQGWLKGPNGRQQVNALFTLCIQRADYNQQYNSKCSSKHDEKTSFCVIDIQI